MARKSAKEISEMYIAYKDTAFPVTRLQRNFQESYFSREELIEFLNSLSTPKVKVALAMIPNTNDITVVLLGVNNSGVIQADSDGLYDPIPCPPKCRTQAAIKNKIIISG